MQLAVLISDMLCDFYFLMVLVPYVKVHLASSATHRKLAKRKTKPAKRAADPAFYERLYFTESDLRDKYLKVGNPLPVCASLVNGCCSR